ncbi:MAG: DUF2333 family protein [Methylococcaceae bacterium]|nr:DUF2333 family protein [Methylococcaceae bacterium]MCI0666458.1 DUF2333 family protein [Methylococcaceae bacterium]MCI0732471.1 DUF2333 family protein [Methylococcaceae bacterium]
MSKFENKATWQSSIASGQSKSALATMKSRGLIWSLTVSLAILLLIYTAYVTFVSLEPDPFDVVKTALDNADLENSEQLPVGYVQVNTLAAVAETLLNKNGGYLSNDIFPGSLIDNMPSWEYGVVVMVRDGASALRNHFARSQSQSRENPELSKAEPLFYFTHDSWMLPSTEDEYQKGIENLRSYQDDLRNPRGLNAHFYARADNLDNYLQVIIKRLGDYSYRLSASSVQKQTYDPTTDKISITKTPWMEVDDVFWEARGAAWALLHFFKAIEIDFAKTLRGKAANATLRQIIQELEDSQSAILSPVILNGDGFGMFANYSLTMANHIARANAAAIDLRELMLRG